LAFSHRLHWDSAENALTRLLRDLQARGRSVLDLTESNPARAGLVHGEEILAPLADPRALQYQPDPAGLAEARRAVAAYYATRGAAVAPERILLTASTSEAYGFLFKTLCDPGEEILVPRPSYPLFEHLAALEGIVARSYPLICHDGWWIDFDALRAAATGRTRAIVLVNPNNPTGSFLKRRELDELRAICAEGDLILIADEVFSDCAFGADADRVVTLAPEDAPSVSLHGFSKLLGLPQMKLGWMVLNGPDGWRSELRHRLLWVADTYLPVSAPVQYAAGRWLALQAEFQRRMTERLLGNLARLDTALRGQSLCSRLRIEGGWYTVLRVPRTRTDEEWALQLLREESVLVQPGYFFDFDVDGHLVISLLTAPAVFREGVERLLESVNA
jgi:alanine-synthesizing transaminase